MNIKPAASTPPYGGERALHPSAGQPGWLLRRWLPVTLTLLGIFAFLPFMAPVLAERGWETPAKAIYTLYSFFCHQLPQRSYFLFGERLTYGLNEIQLAWRDTTDPLILRQFIGNARLGWKVAWSDRMVAMFTSLWLFGAGYAALRRWIRPLPWWGLALLLLPLAMDGGSHFVSDLAGLGQGFRDSNAWLAALTGNALPARFYAGDSWGSFNAWMRLLTGVLFGLGVAWVVFPRLEGERRDALQNGESALYYAQTTKRQ